jgi:HD superfamily phosphohydrolase YqeK
MHPKVVELRKQLQQVGAELVKVARRDGEEFDCATWLHKAKEMPKEGLKYAVERHLTGRGTAEREKNSLHTSAASSQDQSIPTSSRSRLITINSPEGRG